ncbi:hypothetical protein GCM10020221_25920 [Streptomyces thioluteus]|uniref:Uncharacterized protein n=1 Tax=Streptomyces thioluteus TaxID=66431 RepID=A0ABN3WXT7_STRTU
MEDASRPGSRQGLPAALDAQWVACKHPAVISIWPKCNVSANRAAGVPASPGRARGLRPGAAVSPGCGPVAGVQCTVHGPRHAGDESIGIIVWLVTARPVRRCAVRRSPGGRHGPR